MEAVDRVAGARCVLLTANKQDDKHQVWEEGGEVDHLARGLDALDEAQADDEPGGQQAEAQVPLEAAEVVPPVVHQTQHVVTDVQKDNFRICSLGNCQ